MKIGLSTSVIQRGRTGIAQYVFALLRAFQRQGGDHRFTLFVLEDDLPHFYFAESKMEVVPVPERFRPPVKNILWHQRHLPRQVREHGLDVLHIPSYRRMLWPRPCPLVATIHDLAPFRVPKKYDWMRMFYGRVVVRRLAWRQDALIAISHHTAGDISTCFGIPPDRLTVIHNGLDHDRFSPDSPKEAKAAAARDFGLTKPFFLYVARLEHPGKNHVRLIDAFNRFKDQTGSDWQLVMAGSDWHGAEIIHSRIQQSPHAKDIRTPGFIPDRDLPMLNRAAEVFVFPSLYEGFGLPPVEAMACGCPVISSTRGSLGEVVGDAAVTIDPENIDDMKTQMIRLATDADLRDQLRSAGLTQAKRFDWDRTAAATMDVYQRVFDKAGPRAGRIE